MSGFDSKTILSHYIDQMTSIKHIPNSQGCLQSSFQNFLAGYLLAADENTGSLLVLPIFYTPLQNDKSFLLSVWTYLKIQNYCHIQENSIFESLLGQLLYFVECLAFLSSICLTKHFIAKTEFDLANSLAECVSTLYIHS